MYERLLLAVARREKQQQDRTEQLAMQRRWRCGRLRAWQHGWNWRTRRWSWMQPWTVRRALRAASPACNASWTHMPTSSPSLPSPWSVSLSFSACLATPAVGPLVAAKPCQVVTASAYCTHKPCLHIMSPPQHGSHLPLSKISQAHHLQYSNGLWQCVCA